MDKPLRLTANRFCGCSGWALAPFFVVFLLVLLFALVLRWRNASLAGVFAGRRVVWFLWLCVIYRFACPIGHDCLCTNIFSAYDHVRTEPSARHRPHSRKKIKNITQASYHSISYNG